MNNKIYPRSGYNRTVYLSTVVKDPFIEIGDYTIYNDFRDNPLDFQKNNVVYHYPIVYKDHLKIGKFCSIACGAKFMFNCAFHSLKSLSSYTFPLFYEEWDLNMYDVPQAWKNRGDIVIGNDVWIGCSNHGRSSYWRRGDYWHTSRGNQGCRALYNRGWRPRKALA